MTPLKEKLEQIKKETQSKIDVENKKNGENSGVLSDTRMYFNEKFVNTKAKFSEIWEKFKDKIIPALIISFIYYIIWLIFFKLIPIILKYLINVAQQFK